MNLFRVTRLHRADYLSYLFSPNSCPQKPTCCPTLSANFTHIKWTSRSMQSKCDAQRLLPEIGTYKEGQCLFPVIYEVVESGNYKPSCNHGNLILQPSNRQNPSISVLLLFTPISEITQ